MAGGSTAAQVIDRLAEVTGELRARFDRLSRELRAAGLWPVGEPGRNRAGIPTPEQMANMLFAHAAADPYPEAPRVVSMYAVMMPRGRERSFVQTDSEDGLTTTASVMGEPNEWKWPNPQWEGIDLLRIVVAGLIRQFSDPEQRAQLSALKPELLVTMGSRPSAALSFLNPDGWRTADIYRAPQPALPLEARPKGEVIRTALIPTAVFEMLGDLWRVTEEHRRAAPTLPVPTPAISHAGPEKEDAALLPKSAAPIRDHDRDLRDQMPVVGRLEARDVCANTQAQASRTSGQSPPFFEVLTHERRLVPAFAPGA